MSRIHPSNINVGPEIIEKRKKFGTAPASSTSPNNHSRKFYCLGLLQIFNGIYSFIIGLSCIILTATTTNERHDFDVIELEFLLIGGGLWCGSMMVIAGIFGVIAGKSPLHSKILVSMVLAIFAATFASILTLIEFVSLYILTPPLQSKYVRDRNSFKEYFVGAGPHELVGLHKSLIAVSLLEVTIATMHVSFSCRSLCCQPPLRSISSEGATYVASGSRYLATDLGSEEHDKDLEEV